MYSLLKKETSNPRTDPCQIEIQGYECNAPCPGVHCGQSYLHAIGILAHGGTQLGNLVGSQTTTHELLPPSSVQLTPRDRRHPPRDRRDAFMDPHANVDPCVKCVSSS